MKNPKLQLQLDSQLLHHYKKKSYTHLENHINSLDEQVTKPSIISRTAGTRRN